MLADEGGKIGAGGDIERGERLERGIESDVELRGEGRRGEVVDEVLSKRTLLGDITQVYKDLEAAEVNNRAKQAFILNLSESTR